MHSSFPLIKTKSNDDQKIWENTSEGYVLLHYAVNVMEVM